MRKRLALVLLTALAALLAFAASARPLRTAKTLLMPFDSAPFPYHGTVPNTGKPFLDVVEGEKRGHRALRGGVYWEEQTYSDRRVLISIPRGFDVRKPLLMVVFFHGNGALLARDVQKRQQVPRQVRESGLNAVLLAPQFARDAADSSAGRFWEPYAFRQFLDEAAVRLSRLIGDPAAQAAFERAPVVIVAYSGGYLPTAYVLEHGGVFERICGVVLLDALYGDHDKYLDWLERQPPAFLVSAYGPLVRAQNLVFEKKLSENGIGYTTEFPPQLVPGMHVFLDAGSAVKHQDFVTRAWARNPLQVMLSRIPGYWR